MIIKNDNENVGYGCNKSFGGYWVVFIFIIFIIVIYWWVGYLVKEWWRIIRSFDFIVDVYLLKIYLWELEIWIRILSIDDV